MPASSLSANDGIGGRSRGWTIWPRLARKRLEQIPELFQRDANELTPSADAGLREELLESRLVAMPGLLPAALSNAIGAQTQKPLAVVVIGGALFVAFLTRVVRPPMLLLARRWFPPPDAIGPPS